MKKQTLWVTQTGVFLALLMVLQAITTPLGNTMVTGSAVNLLLVLAVMLAGFSSGIAIAALSPVLAKLLGIGPLWSLIPFIIMGNLALVLLWHLIGPRGEKQGGRAAFLRCLISTVIGAAGKFAVLYGGIVLLAVPLLLNLPEKQGEVISAMFSFPQLVTALIGGGLASVLLPPLKKAFAKWGGQ